MPGAHERGADAPGAALDESPGRLVARVRAGDADAFEVLYRAWHPRVLALARACSGRDEAFCLDVTQEVMLRLATRVPSLADGRALGAWLARATVRASVDALRRESRRARRERAAAGREGVAEGAVDAGSGVDEAWLRAQVRGLGATDFDVLHAHLVQRATLREAGLAAGVSEGSATGRVRRVLAKLRAAAREVLG
jgi:RNA polymerase sigma factor (sigma-70 family)